MEIGKIRWDFFSHNSKIVSQLPAFKEQGMVIANFDNLNSDAFNFQDMEVLNAMLTMCLEEEMG